MVNVVFNNVDSGDMISLRLSGVEDIENKRKQIFDSAKLILKDSRFGNKKVVEEALKFVSSTTLCLADYQKSLQNIQSCNMIIVNIFEDKFKCMQMRLENVYSIMRSGGTEKHSF